MDRRRGGSTLNSMREEATRNMHIFMNVIKTMEPKNRDLEKFGKGGQMVERRVKTK